MRIAMVTSECEPFAKTGGLADVVDALSRVLGARGHEVDVYLPRYRGLEPPAGAARAELHVPVGIRPGSAAAASAAVTLWTASDGARRIRLVDHPSSFDRATYYGDGKDYDDNAARFALLGRAALAAIAHDGDAVDVLHGHDWQSGPALLADAMGQGAPGRGVPAARMLTCHNLAYHGWVARDGQWQLGLPATGGRSDGVDLLREAIGVADLVNTVSPNYARESLTPEHGGGLEDALRSLGGRYIGILNGIDTSLWDPGTDTALPANYARGRLEGKRICRAELCARHGLDPDGAIFGMVGRLDPQKGFDLVAAAARDLLAAGGRLIVLGTGDARLLADLRTVASESPDRVVLIDRFDRDEARRIYAGADVFLMPSRFEPSGQGQLIALRYGTPPLVRRTGGLADTIRDAGPSLSTGNGFVFGDPAPAAFMDAVQRAMKALSSSRVWAALVDRGMAEDHGWEAPAGAYEAAYERAMGIARGARSWM